MGKIRSLCFAVLCLLFLSLNAFADYTTLPDSRFLTFDDYDDAVWTHTGDSAPPRQGAALRNGTIHEHSSGWYIEEARTGYAGSYGMNVPPDDSANYAANLRNVAGAYIESPFYTNGVGTVYFDVVNGENPPDAGPMHLKVYMATNMYNSGTGVYVDLEPVEGGGPDQ